MLTKESFLETKNIDSVYNLFAGLGLKCHKTEDGLDVEITDDGNDFVEVHIVSDTADIEKKSRKFRYGCYCRLFISSDYEYWTFTRKTMEDGIRLHKYRFSKNRIRENAKAIPLQKLSSLKFNDLKSFDELFERKDITKKFYDDFKKLIDGFIKEIKNIKDPEHTRWYASVLINRLLFIYFIQHKELLGEKDTSYLSNKLKEFAKSKKNKFYTDFLSKLFFEGFAKKQTRPKEIEEVLGKIPYLNGGLFQKHKLEILYPNIEIADKAFEKIFTYFDAWSWDLDEKKDTAENEINPDVLGYIFEKFTNQKQMGAYYTKEDITGYICKYTIIPWLLERANESKSMQSFFTKLLQADPDRYIYSAVSHGCKYDLPTEISKGIKTVSARTNWNTQAPEQFGLPTETWREVVARRQRYEEIKEKISSTTININDLITLNLNIIQFVLDAIEQGELEFVQSLYNAIRSITILDPTCGSGAFLLAALNILEDIYEACLNRLAELDAKNPAIQEASSHANWKYFIYKSIILNNLYGVDIMEEAVEICKLRLFLKLISQVESDDNSPNLGIEPLPDIDFNIHAGNTLIGYTKLEDIEKSLLGTLNFYGSELKEIHKKAGDIDVIYDTFRKRQSAESGENSNDEPIQTIKERINSEMKLLNDKLDRFLAISYNISETEYKDKKKYEKDFVAWKLTHLPFHWVIEYYRIMKNGGFDVIVGNPPYVEYSKVKKEYAIKGYETEECGNLYAYVIEESMKVLNIKKGYLSFIVPSASVSTPRMNILKNKICLTFNENWFSIFDERPGKLFVGVDQQLSIIIAANSDNPSLRITRMIHWNTSPDNERDVLFENLKYQSLTKDRVYADVSPKIDTAIELNILEKMYKGQNKFYKDIYQTKNLGDIYYRNAGGRYWRLVKSFPSYFKSENGATRSTTELILQVPKKLVPHFVCMLGSSLFYFYWRVVSNCRHLTNREIEAFPVRESILLDTELEKLKSEFETSLKENAVRKTLTSKSSGTIKMDEFFIYNSKPIIDEIDRVLAKHYGFTEEELDYIINYDIKYRMGKELEGNDD